jgi:hypothetical protein
VLANWTAWRVSRGDTSAHHATGLIDTVRKPRCTTYMLQQNEPLSYQTTSYVCTSSPPQMWLPISRQADTDRVRMCGANVRWDPLHCCEKYRTFNSSAATNQGSATRSNKGNRQLQPRRPRWSVLLRLGCALAIDENTLLGGHNAFKCIGAMPSPLRAVEGSLCHCSLRVYLTAAASVLLWHNAVMCWWVVSWYARRMQRSVEGNCLSR